MIVNFIMYTRIDYYVYAHRFLFLEEGLAT